MTKKLRYTTHWDEEMYWNEIVRNIDFNSKKPVFPYRRNLNFLLDM